MIRKLLSFLLVFASLFASAQDAAAPQMADAFRQDGKIYVVIAVISLIFLAIIAFLIYTERKIKSLENKVQNFKTGH